MDGLGLCPRMSNAQCRRSWTCFKNKHHVFYFLPNWPWTVLKWTRVTPSTQKRPGRGFVYQTIYLYPISIYSHIYVLYILYYIYIYRYIIKYIHLHTCIYIERKSKDRKICSTINWKNTLSKLNTHQYIYFFSQISNPYRHPSTSLPTHHPRPSAATPSSSDTVPPSAPDDVFFRPEVQRLSWPQHVLVLRSAAAGTCDDRVCEHWGESEVKCLYRGCMADWDIKGDPPQKTPGNLLYRGGHTDTTGITLKRCLEKWDESVSVAGKQSSHQWKVCVSPQSSDGVELEPLLLEVCCKIIRLQECNEVLEMFLTVEHCETHWQ